MALTPLADGSALRFGYCATLHTLHPNTLLKAVFPFFASIDNYLLHFVILMKSIVYTGCMILRFEITSILQVFLPHKKAVALYGVSALVWSITLNNENAQVQPHKPNFHYSI
jgi:hypothetical protein